MRSAQRYSVAAQAPSPPPDNANNPSYRRASGGGPRKGGKPKAGRGASYESGTRRKGRPAWQRSPDDTPLRDGNRDRLVGLLTDR